MVCSQFGQQLKDCLALGPPQSVQLSRCPDNDFYIDKREKVGNEIWREREKNAVEREWDQDIIKYNKKVYIKFINSFSLF